MNPAKCSLLKEWFLLQKYYNFYKVCCPFVRARSKYSASLDPVK